MPKRAESLKEIIVNRRSVRSYDGQPISIDILHQLVEAGIYAPSGSNAQSQRFLVINDPTEIKRIGKFRWVLPYPSKAPEDVRRSRKPSGILENAGAVIIVFSDNSKTDNRDNGEYFIWKKLEVQNCSASIQNILLMATAMGIGSVWVSANEEMNYTRMLSGTHWRQVLGHYNIPPWYEVQGMVILGYPKHISEDGFPIGEKRHGVSWGNVERGPVANYLIKELASHTAPPPLPMFVRIQRRLLSIILKANVNLSLRLSKALYKIEYHYIKKMDSQESAFKS